jgi:AhpD family alkylhydroperoxidase
MKIRVFDPPMCCSTGVCGPSVDPELVRFAADLDWLKAQGVEIERFNLSQQPFDFTGDPEVNAALQAGGVDVLPIVKVGGRIQSQGCYPTREQLAAWAEVEAPTPSIYTDVIAELVAIGAAIASNCESCFKAHYDRARKLGVSKEDMMRAVKTAQSVREVPAKSVFGLAERYLEGKRTAAEADRTAIRQD